MESRSQILKQFLLQRCEMVRSCIQMIDDVEFMISVTIYVFFLKKNSVKSRKGINLLFGLFLPLRKEITQEAGSPLSWDGHPVHQPGSCQAPVGVN